MNIDTLNQDEVAAVRALAPERGTRPARVVRRAASLADHKLPWFAASAVLLAAEGRRAVAPVVLGWAGVALSSLVAAVLGGAAGGAVLAGCRVVGAHPGALGGSLGRAVARLAPLTPG